MAEIPLVRGVRRLAGRQWWRLRTALGVPDIDRRRLRQAYDTGQAAAPGRRGPPGSLAVVIPVYGHAPYVAATVHSVAAQTRLPDELVIVDDASPDASSTVIEAALRETAPPLRDRARLLRNAANLGQAAALNRAMTATRSDLVMVLNDDDLLFRDAVELVLELFRLHPDLHLVGSICIPFSGVAPTEPALARPGAPLAAGGVPLTLRTPADVLGYRNANDFNVTHSSCTFRREAWQAVGGYQSDRRRRITRSADRDFQLRVNARFPVATADRTPLAYWRADCSVDAARLS